MSLEYSFKISAHLESYNIMYEEFSPNCRVLYLLLCAYYFGVKEDDFEEMFN